MPGSGNIFRILHCNLPVIFKALIEIPVSHVFDAMTCSSSTLYSVWVSFAELYNERVYDLLDTSTFGKNKRRKELKLMQDRNGYVYIKGIYLPYFFKPEFAASS